MMELDVENGFDICLSNKITLCWDLTNNNTLIIPEQTIPKLYAFHLFAKQVRYYNDMDTDIIAQQIQELKHQPQIQYINTIKPYNYEVVYTPKLHNSPYSHLTYHLKLILPQRYPELPPKLVFLDKIYHLNIETSSGKVSMSLLSDDWSPYLTLVAVFDSLNSLLEEPDINYPASPNLQDQYVHQPQKYAQKVQQFIRVVQSAREENGQSVIEHVEVINDSKINDRIQFQQQNPDFVDKELAHHFENSAVFSEIRKIKPLKTLSSQNQKGEEIRIQTESEISPKAVYRPFLSLPNNNQEQAQTFRSKVPKESVKSTNQSKEAQNRQQKNQQLFNHKQISDQVLKSRSQLQKMELNLKQADSLLDILISQSNNMEQCIQNSQNSKIKGLLQVKQERVAWMLEQTLELASQLREQIFLNIKAAAQDLLK